MSLSPSFSIVARYVPCLSKCRKFHSTRRHFRGLRFHFRQNSAILKPKAEAVSLGKLPGRKFMDVTDTIEGVLTRSLQRYSDARGWLSELFRLDELPEGFQPAMGYFSVTKPGIARGPHEHVHQTDAFAFLDGQYELHLWENRPSMGEKHVVLRVGAESPTLVFVPPGVVHAYKNIGNSDAFVLNFPNQLYAGEGKKQPVDEIRHESDPASPFRL